MQFQSFLRRMVRASAAALCCTGAIFAVPSATAQVIQTGACCTPSPNGGLTCTVTTEADCAGHWVGSGTQCTSTSCVSTPPPTGACCATSAGAITCSVTTQAACTGSWRGGGTTCTNDICVPRFVCCYVSANTTGTQCSLFTQAECASHSGTLLTNATSCSPFPCPRPSSTEC